MTLARLDPGRTVGAADVMPGAFRTTARATTVAGALIGLSIATMLSLAGAAIGFSLTDPWGASGLSIGSLSTGALVWLLLVDITGMGIGGIVAARLHATDAFFERHETEVRLLVQALTAWAVAIIIAGMAAASITVGTAGIAERTTATGSMMDQSERQLGEREPLKSEPTKQVAAVWGFVALGVGATMGGALGQR